jgi:hypothetical protein
MIQSHLDKLKKDNTKEERDNFNTHKNGTLKIIDEKISIKDIQTYL